jgi:hypothetical protein
LCEGGGGVAGWYNTNHLVEVVMKKIALIVAIVYWVIIALTTLVSQFSAIKYSVQDSVLKVIVALAVNALIAAVLFLLVWGIGSLFKRK